MAKPGPHYHYKRIGGEVTCKTLPRATDLPCSGLFFQAPVSLLKVLKEWHPNILGAC